MPTKLYNLGFDLAQQPRCGVALKKDHPAVDGLSLALVGGVPINLATGGAVEVHGSPTRSTNARGVAVGPFPSASDYLKTSARLPSSGKTGGSLLIVGRIGVGSTYQRILYPGKDEAIAYRLVVFSPDNNGIIEPFWRGHRWVGPVVFTPGGKAVAWGIAMQDWSTGAGLAEYADGKDVSSGREYIGNYGASYSSNDVIIGASISEGYSADTYEQNLLLLWPDRGLPKWLLKSLTENPWQLFESDDLPLFKPVVTAQYAHPVSDVSAGGWTASTGSDLFAMLDETAADDGDYITTTSASTCEVALGGLSDPAVSTGHIVRYRISATGGGIIVRLREGSTTIASWTHNPAPDSPTTYAQTLSGGEADSITNYAALKLQFEAIA